MWSTKDPDSTVRSTDVLGLPGLGCLGGCEPPAVLGGCYRPQSHHFPLISQNHSSPPTVGALGTIDVPLGWGLGHHEGRASQGFLSTLVP